MKLKFSKKFMKAKDPVNKENLKLLYKALKNEVNNLLKNRLIELVKK